jgi:hypothetical protein
MGRVLLLLAEAPSQPRRKPADLERITAYDFFADSPFLLFDDGATERNELLVAGFDPSSLSYHSSSQRFASRRAVVHNDIAHLLARGLCIAAREGAKVTYSITERGQATADTFSSSYAHAYRKSVRRVAKHLNHLADGALREEVERRVEAHDFLIDLYGHTPEPTQ